MVENYDIDKRLFTLFKIGYLNGEKNGKGIEEYEIYYNYNFIFEGEYIKGKKNGKGKLYYIK